MYSQNESLKEDSSGRRNSFIPTQSEMPGIIRTAKPRDELRFDEARGMHFFGKSLDELDGKNECNDNKNNHRKTP